ncbi:MAG: hypothetical protein Fur002_04140 [Anaerolineales bacterium]
MNLKRFFILLTIFALLVFGAWLPANGTTQAQQQIPTPTAGADGRILYIAQAGDSCIRIAAIHSITVEELRRLNSKLDEACTIVVGQEYLIGIVSMEGVPTEGPSPTPAPPTPSPTPFSGTTEICVLLFDDMNGNAQREETEPAVSGGAISVTEKNGEYTSSLPTNIPADPTAYQGICFENVPEGEYTVTVGVPDNYNPTMNLNYSFAVKAGDRAFLDFGVQSKDVVVDVGAQTTPTTRSPWLGILGAIFLLGGAGLGYYAWRNAKPESKLSGGGMLRK